MVAGTSTAGPALTFSSLLLVFFSSSFLLPALDLVLVIFPLGLAMAAARAAATLSAAADGLTGVVVLTALLEVAEDELRGKVELAEDELRGKVELEVLEVAPVSLLVADVVAVLAVVVVVVRLTGGLGPVFFSSGFGLVVAAVGRVEDGAGRDLVLEVELALEVWPDMVDGVLLAAEVGRLEAAGLGSLPFPASGFGLASVGFLVLSSGLAAAGFLSRGLAAAAAVVFFGVALSAVPALLVLSEPVVDPDLVDFVSSLALLRPAKAAEPARLPVAVVVVEVGLVVVAAAVVDLAAVLGPGAAFTAGLPAGCFTPTLGRAPPLADFLGEPVLATSTSGLAPFSLVSFSRAFLSRGAGDLSFTGVAGVIFKLGIPRLALAVAVAPTVSPVSTEVSCSSSCPGENSASSSSPVSPGVFSMNPTSSLASKETPSASPFPLTWWIPFMAPLVLISLTSCSCSSLTMEQTMGSTSSITGCCWVGISWTGGTMVLYSSGPVSFTVTCSHGSILGSW